MWTIGNGSENTYCIDLASIFIAIYLKALPFRILPVPLLTERNAYLYLNCILCLIIKTNTLTSSNSCSVWIQSEVGFGWTQMSFCCPKFKCVVVWFIVFVNNDHRNNMNVNLNSEPYFSRPVQSNCMQSLCWIWIEKRQEKWEIHVCNDNRNVCIFSNISEEH